MSEQLSVPTVRRQYNDLIVTSPDGKSSTQVMNYFDNLDNGAAQIKFEGLNFPVELGRYPRGGSLWMTERTTDDVVFGADFNLNIISDDGNDVSVNGLNVISGDGDDVIITGAGDDYLCGDPGNDWLYGGDGDDDLLGLSGNDQLYGQDGDDRLQGGEGDDLLDAGAGNDILIGGTGSDSLEGAEGDDTYMFYPGDGKDTISNAAAPGDRDIMQFRSGITKDQLWFRRIGDDLQVSVIGTEDAVTFSGWYVDAAQRVDQIEVRGGDVRWKNSRYLSQGGVDALVEAMSAFSPPALGVTSLPDDYANVLTPVLAAQWQ